jgi:hypothetical protein
MNAARCALSAIRRKAPNASVNNLLPPEEFNPKLVNMSAPELIPASVWLKTGLFGVRRGSAAPFRRMSTISSNTLKAKGIYP